MQKDKPGIAAISATNIQLVFNADPAKWKLLGLTPQSTPEKVLGTTIYLYQSRLALPAAADEGAKRKRRHKPLLARCPSIGPILVA